MAGTGLRNVQRLTFPLWQPFLRASWQVETHLPVHTPHTFVIPRLAIQAEPIKALPEAPAGICGDDLIEAFDHHVISTPCTSVGAVVGRPGEPYDGAGTPYAQSVFRHQVGYCLALHRWR